MNPDQEQLFPELNTARYGDKRLRQNLFLPKYLKGRANDFRLRDEAQERAYKIMVRWADLESSGKLLKKKETALEGEFLTEVFGQALGYTLFSENEKAWNVEPKFSVNGGIADAAIGLFEESDKRPPQAIIELKGPTSNLDRDRARGRTPVQQCWDYLNAQPECPWGIVCNYVSFRLYHRSQSSRTYQLFVLQDLRREEVFREFYCLFEKEGLLPATPGAKPRAEVLLEKTGEQQRVVGDELYQSYHRNRIEMIHHLTGPPHDKPLEKGIHIAQKLLDRVIFVAFCEDRGLLPDNLIHRAYSEFRSFDRVTNPRWQNFLGLFRCVDEGDKQRGISPYNGGLFRKDDEVDNLQLDDKWTGFFENIAKYDFRDEVSVDVLGHFFEKSVSDIGQIRLGGLFGEKIEDDDKPKMLKSAERKRSGIYYTPPEFTDFIAFNVIGRLVDQRFADIASRHGIDAKTLWTTKPNAGRAKYWRECLDALRRIRIVDPACGSGAFLISAYDLLADKYQDVVDQLIFHESHKTEALTEGIPDYILSDNLFGVDLSPEAVEITQLALWIRSARPGRTLSDLSRNIVCGNSLVSDQEVHPRAMEWEETFPDVFDGDNPGFDGVIGNPPWERMKLQEREFFDAASPEIASAVNAATRRKLIAELKKSNPELHERYTEAKTTAERTLAYVRKSGRFPLTGKGDINTYATFAELAHSIVAADGRVGLLVPSGIATDHTYKEFFAELTGSKSLIGLYDFENKAPIFPDVHRSLKFSVLLFGGAETQSDSADFVFFAHRMEELKDKQRHIALSVDDIKLLNPNTRTCPIFRSQRDAELTKAVYRRVPILVDQNRREGGNPWGIKFLRMFDQTNDAELFKTGEELKKARFKRDGSVWKKGKKTFLPLYEAKMVQMYDHRAAGVVIDPDNWMRQGQTRTTVQVEHQNPEFTAEPRWWVDGAEVSESNSQFPVPSFLGFKDITSATNQRTMIASMIPWSAVTNHFPLILTHQSRRQELCLLANLNSFVLDFVVRQKVGAVTLNFFIVEQFPIFGPDFYQGKCPWNRRTTLEKWISDRVLKLTCTSNDMKPLATAAGFDPAVHPWKPAERADLMAQLDAAYFLLYGIERDDVEYILSTFQGVAKEDEGMFGGSGTLDRILDHYDRLLETSGRK